MLVCGSVEASFAPEQVHEEAHHGDAERSADACANCRRFVRLIAAVGGGNVGGGCR